MEIKEKLNKIKKQQFILELLQERITSLRSILTIVSPETTHYKVQGSTKDQLANNISKLLETESKLCETAAEIQEKIDEEISMLEKLPKKHMEIIYFRFIKGMKWEEIEKRTHYSNTQCRRLRTEALEMLEDGR